MDWGNNSFTQSHSFSIACSSSLPFIRSPASIQVELKRVAGLIEFCIFVDNHVASGFFVVVNFSCWVCACVWSKFVEYPSWIEEMCHFNFYLSSVFLICSWSVPSFFLYWWSIRSLRAHLSKLMRALIIQSAHITRYSFDEQGNRLLLKCVHCLKGEKQQQMHAYTHLHRIMAATWAYIYVGKALPSKWLKKTFFFFSKN